MAAQCPIRPVSRTTQAARAMPAGRHHPQDPRPGDTSAESPHGRPPAERDVPRVVLRSVGAPGRMSACSGCCTSTWTSSSRRWRSSAGPSWPACPSIVGGRGDPTERAVVSTASYEARAYGVHSGMPLRLAARKCPDAVFLPVDGPAYDAVSAVVMETLRAIPGAAVQVLGWDEAFVGIESRRPGPRAGRPLRAGGRARGDRAALLGRHRRHHRARQDRHRVRQAARHLPAHPRELVRGDGREADQGPVGHRQPDQPAARRPWASRPCASSPRPPTSRWSRSSGPTPARTSAGSVVASAPTASTTPRGWPGPTAARRPTSRTW